MLSYRCYPCLHLITPSLRILGLGVSVDDDEIELIVDTEDRLDSVGHLSSGRWL